jgi:2-polyprenyl-6-hydroxyphenyl methylase/3-demethylubiquinone-9 3-methyltransferase
MSIGTAVRARLGRFEQPVAEAYRAMFIDLDDLARQAGAVAPGARRILEIGCGDGSVADRVVRTHPHARYLGIDVSAAPGRRYTGAPDRATFVTMTSGQLRATEPVPYDLVLVVDVLHHVHDLHDRAALLADAAALLAADGTLVVKEWARGRHPAYFAGAVADRYVSGDRDARFMDRAELSALLAAAVPELAVATSSSVRPWSCNMLVTARRQSQRLRRKLR